MSNKHLTVAASHQALSSIAVLKSLKCEYVVAYC